MLTPMSQEAMLISVAIIAVFAVFAAVLIWADRRTSRTWN